MGNSHFVVVLDWAYDKVYDEGIEIVAVTHTLEEAKEFFQSRLAEERKFANDQDWDIVTDDEVEFAAAKLGYYTTDHTHLYIEEVRN